MAKGGKYSSTSVTLFPEGVGGSIGWSFRNKAGDSGGWQGAARGGWQGLKAESSKLKEGVEEV